MRKVGIVLVNYNGLQDTIDCISSIKMSEYSNYEIIVIDNNSEEDVILISQYDDVVYKKLQKNVGFGVANNIGADIAVRDNCDLILCLNNDTVIEKDTISILEKNTNDKTISTGAIYYYSKPHKLWYGGGEVSKYKGHFRHKQYASTRNVSFITGCCVMLTVDCYKKIGLFSPEYFMYYEDSDFSIKAMKNGYKLKYVFEAKIYHKIGRSISKSAGLKEYYLTRNRLYILNKYHDYFLWTAYLYFYFTRGIYIINSKLQRTSTAPYFEGIKDYLQGKMGEKKTKC